MTSFTRDGNMEFGQDTGSGGEISNDGKKTQFRVESADKHSALWQKHGIHIPEGRVVVTQKCPSPWTTRALKSALALPEYSALKFNKYPGAKKKMYILMNKEPGLVGDGTIIDLIRYSSSWKKADYPDPAEIW